MSVSRRDFFRRLLLWGGVPASVLGTVAWGLNRKLNPHTPLAYPFPASSGGSRQPTPECAEREPTERVTEGPFYKPATPERQNLREPDTAGIPLTLRGRVVSQDCRPLAGAVVDVWSCDGNGVYDNAGFRLRGHQFTDADGRFAFETVKPRDYRDFGIHRTPHIHVKVQGRETRLLTTQLFFPGEPLNEGDYFFRDELLVELRRSPPGGMEGWFEFVLASL